MLRFATTIFISAFLLFLVQPLIGRYLLPWFGGGPGVWTACMLFFQVALLVGYLYAHVLVTRFTPRTQMWIHLGVLAAALLMLPIIPNESWKPTPDHDPVWRIVLLLGVTIGVPFAALSTTGPLLQAWFTRTYAGRSPYRLYALSNAGSLLALFAYPFIVEPMLTRKTQAIGWSWAFAAFALLCGYVAVKASRTAPAAASGAIAQPQGTGNAKHRAANADTSSFNARSPILLWLMLPACAVVLLLSITSQISDEVSPMPFLWVLTLAVYLITFIICFEWPQAYHRAIFVIGAALSPWLVWLVLSQDVLSLVMQLTGFLAVLFICGMACHGELYRLRPPPERLTLYYLCIAAGGVIGGTFVAVIAPMIFNTYLEFYLALYGTIVLSLVCMVRDPASLFFRGQKRLVLLVMLFAALVPAYLLQGLQLMPGEIIAARARNFYGTLLVTRSPSLNSDGEFRRLDHGRIAHGAQHFHPFAPDVRRVPTMYYGPNTGAGILLREPPEGGRRVGSVGLGAGTLAAYAVHGEYWRIYEINREVLNLAESYFSFLADARDRGAEIEVVINDARIAMENEPPQAFDVLVLDAFSGDAIPTHLLTREMFAIYDRHLAPDGAIALHITNRYLNLQPVVHRLAQEFGYHMVVVESPEDKNFYYINSRWVVLTRNESLLTDAGLRILGTRITGTSDAPLWTDEYCSLLRALK